MATASTPTKSVNFVYANLPQMGVSGVQDIQQTPQKGIQVHSRGDDGVAVLKLHPRKLDLAAQKATLIVKTEGSWKEIVLDLSEAMAKTFYASQISLKHQWKLWRENKREPGESYASTYERTYRICNDLFSQLKAVLRIQFPAPLQDAPFGALMTPAVFKLELAKEPLGKQDEFYAAETTQIIDFVGQNLEELVLKNLPPDRPLDPSDLL